MKDIHSGQFSGQEKPFPLETATEREKESRTACGRKVKILTALPV